MSEQLFHEQTPSEQPSSPPQPTPQLRQKRSRSWIGALVLVLLLIVMLVGAYAVTLAPEHYAQAQAERVSGSEEIGIGDPAVATVVPADKWSTRPIVTPLIGELQFLKNPAVIFGVSPGVQLGSPDGMLTVSIEPLGDTDAAALLASYERSDAPIQEEELSTGLSVSHVDTRSTADEPVDGLIAIIGSASATGTGAPSQSDSVLVRVTLSDDAKLELSDYRPALSDLFESLELAG